MARTARFDRRRQTMTGASGLPVDAFERSQHDAVFPWLCNDIPLLTGWSSADREVEWAWQELVRWVGVYDKIAVAPALRSR
jgi:hypothetical protein